MFTDPPSSSPAHGRARPAGTLGSRALFARPQCSRTRSPPRACWSPETLFERNVAFYGMRRSCYGGARGRGQRLAEACRGRAQGRAARPERKAASRRRRAGRTRLTSRTIAVAWAGWRYVKRTQVQLLACDTSRELSYRSHPSPLACNMCLMLSDLTKGRWRSPPTAPPPPPEAGFRTFQRERCAPKRPRDACLGKQYFSHPSEALLSYESRPDERKRRENRSAGSDTQATALGAGRAPTGRAKRGERCSGREDGNLATWCRFRGSVRSGPAWQLGSGGPAAVGALEPAAACARAPSARGSGGPSLNNKQ